MELTYRELGKSVNATIRHTDAAVLIKIQMINQAP